MINLSNLSTERLIAAHKKRVEQLRLDWLDAKEKHFTGKMKFIEKLGKLHNKEIAELEKKLQ